MHGPPNVKFVNDSNLTGRGATRGGNNHQYCTHF